MSDAAPAPVPARVRWAVAAGSRVLRLLARTWRVREVGREGWRARRASGEGGVVVALWHGQMLPLVAHHRDEGVAVLISEHRDGEIIARVVRAFGYETVRGSTSRGGGRALLELVGVLRRGREVCVTPDGPRGPRHTFAPGALVDAQRAGVPQRDVAAHVDRAWRLGSWDRFEIPKPFARITVAYSDPTPVPGPTPREAAESAPRFAA
ncbi:lysophospholipid acyltransferase family protein, partial [Roseisolibacter sp. H3M3-2]|uniref:lysophospholipid acyltransferase family protein n=1 Tax=Roseisolibacter sp. H3M3-2 TaxID=3031323 RepID=UPI0023D9B305